MISQFSAISGLLYWSDSGKTELGGSTLVLAGPWVLSNLLTRPKTARMITEGFKIGRKTEAAALLSGFLSFEIEKLVRENPEDADVNELTEDQALKIIGSIPKNVPPTQTGISGFQSPVSPPFPTNLR